jgi:hypothetical protein
LYFEEFSYYKFGSNLIFTALPATLSSLVIGWREQCSSILTNENAAFRAKTK